MHHLKICTNGLKLLYVISIIISAYSLRLVVNQGVIAKCAIIKIITSETLINKIEYLFGDLISLSETSIHLVLPKLIRRYRCDTRLILWNVRRVEFLR